MSKGYKMKIKATDWKGIVVDYIYKRDVGICQLCKYPLRPDQLLEIDHIITKADGGIDTMENIRLVHLECHKKRHSQFKQYIALSEYRGIENLEHRNIKELRKTSDICIVARMRKLLLKGQKMTKVASECGLTYDQARYLKIKYKLGKNPKDWKIENL